MPTLAEPFFTSCLFESHMVCFKATIAMVSMTGSLFYLSEYSDYVMIHVRNYVI